LLSENIKIIKQIEKKSLNNCIAEKETSPNNLKALIATFLINISTNNLRKKDRVV